MNGYLNSAPYNDQQLVRFQYDSREDVFDAITYNKGGAILHYLNKLIGDEAFDRAMYLYLTKNALHSAEAHQWRLAVEEATGQDWTWFFNEWYYHPGHPNLKVTYNYIDAEQKLEVTISQTPPETDSTFLYRLPLKAAVIAGNTKSIADWHITKRSQTYTYKYVNGERPVVVPDIDHVLPGNIKDKKESWQWLAEFKNSNDYISKRLCIGGAGRQLSDSNSQDLIDLALRDSLASTRRDALSLLKTKKSDKFKVKWIPKIIELAKSDTSRKVRAEALGVCEEWKVPEIKEIALKSVFDSSYVVAAYALGALYVVDTERAYQLAKQLLTTNPKGQLESAIWYQIASMGAEADITYFEKEAELVLGSRKYNFALNLSSYIKKAESEQAFMKGIAIYERLISYENLKSFRSSFGGFLFDIAKNEKEETSNVRKEVALRSAARLEIVQKALKKMVDAEQDPDIKKEYAKQMKELE